MFLCTDTDEQPAELSTRTFAGVARPRIFQQFNPRSAGARRSRLTHVSAVEDSGTNVLAEGDESGAAASGESDASPTSLPPGVAAGAAPAKGSASAGEQSPQSLSATGSPVASAHTSPEHSTAPAAAGDASAETAGVKAQTQPAVASASTRSAKPSRFVTTKAPDDILKTSDTAKAPDDETGAHAIASHHTLLK